MNPVTTLRFLYYYYAASFTLAVLDIIVLIFFTFLKKRPIIITISGLTSGRLEEFNNNNIN